MKISTLFEMPVDAYGDVRALVRGLPYQCPDDWEDVLDSLDENSNLYLIKEPDNPKDKLAIAAYLDDRRVGYVAASDNGKIWLYLTDEKMPCKFIDKYDASFKIAFENPRYLFEDIPFKEIYKDRDGVTERSFPTFDIPYLMSPKNEKYEWYVDRTYIMDLERFIPDFRRKLATRMVILVGRKNSKGEYCYYLPYANNILADIHNEEIKDIIDDYGFVIALPDVPIMTDRGGILMDLHITYIKKTDFKKFDLNHQSEIVFNLISDNVCNANEDGQKTNNGSKEDILLTMNDFFPLFGITLGKTSWKQAENLGYKVRIHREGPSRVTDINKISFWDYEGKGIFTSLYWIQTDCDFPSFWKSKGFSWDNSYDEWINIFKNLGFQIKVEKEPCIEEFSGHDSLSAEFRALSSELSLDFKLNFNFGENGCKTFSPKTLYSIYLEYDGECTQYQNNDDIEEVERYEIEDSQEGGKHVSMDVIVPEEGDEDFDFCLYEGRVREKEHIDLIKRYMKRYEEGKEPRPFLMIGRPLLGPTDLDIFYSLDGEKIFNFIFDEKIKGWIRDAGFVLGQVKSYKKDSLFPDQLSVELLVSKRKSGEKLFKQVSEEAMDYIEEYCSSLADKSLEKRIIKEVKRYMSGKSTTPYKVVIVIEYGVGICKTQDGEDIAFVYKSDIIELVETNNGVMGEIIKVEFDDDGEAWFTIRVSRSVPRFILD